jgi:hypothetical protein
MQTYIGSFDLTGEGCQIESYSFGAPRLKSDAATWDASGNQPLAFPGDRHDDCDFELTLTMRGGSASAVEANIVLLLAAFQPGATLTHTEGEASGSRYTFIRTVTEPEISRHVGGWATVTLKGTRCPYWHGTQVEIEESAIDTFGSVDVGVVPGDVPALTRYYASGTGDIVLAVRGTDAGFTWTEDGDTLALGASYADVCSRTVTTSSYAGRFLIAAQVDADAQMRVAVTTGGATVYSKMSVAESGTVLIGPVTLPATGFTRDFPSTDITVQAKGTGALTVSKWALVPIPSPLTTDAAVVHLDSTLCLDGIPQTAPNAYSWDRDTDTFGASTLDKLTPYGWPMLRPGTNTLYAHFTGHLSASYIPRYLLPA